jgi:hypothetical protein
MNWKNYEFNLADIGITMKKGDLMQIRDII